MDKRVPICYRFEQHEQKLIWVSTRQKEVLYNILCNTRQRRVLTFGAASPHSYHVTVSLIFRHEDAHSQHESRGGVVVTVHHIHSA